MFYLLSEISRKNYQKKVQFYSSPSSPNENVVNSGIWQPWKEGNRFLPDDILQLVVACYQVH